MFLSIFYFNNANVSERGSFLHQSSMKTKKSNTTTIVQYNMLYEFKTNIFGQFHSQLGKNQRVNN